MHKIKTQTLTIRTSRAVKYGAQTVTKAGHGR